MVRAAATESGVVVGFPGDIESVRIVERRLVAVGGTVEHHDFLTGRDRGSGDFGCRGSLGWILHQRSGRRRNLLSSRTIAPDHLMVHLGARLQRPPTLPGHLNCTVAPALRAPRPGFQPDNHRRWPFRCVSMFRIRDARPPGGRPNARKCRFPRGCERAALSVYGLPRPVEHRINTSPRR